MAITHWTHTELFFSLITVSNKDPFIAHRLYKNSYSPQPTQETRDTNDPMSDEQIARVLQMDEDMEVRCLCVVITAEMAILCKQFMFLSLFM